MNMKTYDLTKYYITGGGGSGTSDYTELENKPQINGTTLVGNLDADDLGLVDISTFEDNAEVVSVAINELIRDKQDVLTAGSGIDISGNVISATGGSSVPVYYIDFNATSSYQADSSVAELYHLLDSSLDEFKNVEVWINPKTSKFPSSFTEETEIGLAPIKMTAVYKTSTANRIWFSGYVWRNHPIRFYINYKSSNNTFSMSQYIETLVDSSILNDNLQWYQPLLTAGSGITIDSDYVISASSVSKPYCYFSYSGGNFQLYGDYTPETLFENVYAVRTPIGALSDFLRNNDIYIELRKPGYQKTNYTSYRISNCYVDTNNYIVYFSKLIEDTLLLTISITRTDNGDDTFTYTINNTTSYIPNQATIDASIADIWYAIDNKLVGLGEFEENNEVISAAINGLIRDKASAASSGAGLWIGTQAEYDALSSYDPSTLYAIK